MFSLQQLQEESREWVDYNFPNNDPWMPVMGVQEEAGELAHACLKMAQGIRGSEDEHKAEMIDAIGDIIVYLADVCNKYGINLQTCVDITWQQVKQRDWQKNRGDGVTK